ncbi:MAG: hypothetical protein ACLQUY_15320 [Ktedonobacterales bacterium]
MTEQDATLSTAEIELQPMSRHGEPDPLPSSHEPPLTARGSVSPIMAQHQWDRTPLKPAPPRARPVARLGACLIVGSGLLALFGLLLELSLFTVPMVFAFVLAVGGILEGGALLFKTTLRSTNRAMQFAVGGLAVQLIDGLLRLAAGIGQQSGRLEIGYGITAASFLLMLACGWLIMLTGKPTVTEQDISDLGREEFIENLSRTRFGGDHHSGTPL